MGIAGASKLTPINDTESDMEAQGRSRVRLRAASQVVLGYLFDSSREKKIPDGVATAHRTLARATRDVR